MMEYRPAKILADKYLDLLSPACLRIEIVGSVGRADPKSIAEGVHDLEFLLIQKPGHPRPEWGQKTKPYLTHLDKLLADLEYQELIRQAADKKDGPRYKKRVIRESSLINEFCFDMFVVTEETWGIQSLIRMGPSWFSHRAVANQRVRAIEYDGGHIPTGRTGLGFLPNDLTYIRAKDSPDGLSHIKRGDEILSLPEESDVFNLIFGRWIAPADRRAYAENTK